jgi:hypothetical protein
MHRFMSHGRQNTCLQLHNLSYRASRCALHHLEKITCNLQRDINDERHFSLFAVAWQQAGSGCYHATINQLRFDTFMYLLVWSMLREHGALVPCADTSTNTTSFAHYIHKPTYQIRQGQGIIWIWMILELSQILAWSVRVRASLCNRNGLEYRYRLVTTFGSCSDRLIWYSLFGFGNEWFSSLIVVIQRKKANM